MHDRGFPKDFKRGAETGLLSTTSDLYTAVKFAVSHHPILFRLQPSGNESMGAQINFLSVYPEEEEYLYPPLTILDRRNLKIRTVEIDKGFLGLLPGGFAITVVDLEPGIPR